MTTEITGYNYRNRRATKALSMTTATHELRYDLRPRASYVRVKRVFDVVACVLLLPILLIPALICALAILVDTWGPVFFVQRRTGINGTRFRMVKFRTMVANAEELKSSLRHLNKLPAPDFKVADDPRVTKVGKILRKTGLDELPQIMNVLRGDMSLVGPRPTSFDASTYEPWQLGRLAARPGITGLWQVEARNSVAFDERVKYDLDYIDSMSLGTDVKILFRTIGTALRGEGQ